MYRRVNLLKMSSITQHTGGWVLTVGGEWRSAVDSVFNNEYRCVEIYDDRESRGIQRS